MHNRAYGTQTRRQVRSMASNRRGHLFFLPGLSQPSLRINISAQILASCSYDDTVKLYIDDPSDDWFCFSTLEGHASTVWSIAWSPKGNYLASASDDKTVRIWKRIAEHKWACVLVLSGHERSVYSVSWSEGNGKQGEDSLGWLASTGGDGSVRIWELSVYNPICIYSKHNLTPSFRNLNLKNRYRRQVID